MNALLQDVISRLQSTTRRNRAGWGYSGIEVIEKDDADFAAMSEQEAALEAKQQELATPAVEGQDPRENTFEILHMLRPGRLDTRALGKSWRMSQRGVQLILDELRQWLAHGQLDAFGLRAGNLAIPASPWIEPAPKPCSKKQQKKAKRGAIQGEMLGGFEMRLEMQGSQGTPKGKAKKSRARRVDRSAALAKKQMWLGFAEVQS